MSLRRPKCKYDKGESQVGHEGFLLTGFAGDG